MKPSKRPGNSFGLVVAAILLAAMAASAMAQQKYPIAYTVSAEDTRYPQQFTIDVGDVPNHQVRIYEIQRTHTKSQMLFRGVKVVDTWIRGISDYTDYSGATSGYIVYLLENGDRIHARYSGAVQSVNRPDGAREYVYHGNTNLTGGTGAFRNIRGQLRDVTKGLSKGGKALSNEIRGEGEYWFEE